MSFGDRIKEARKKKGYTQKQLADLICAKHNSVSNWENDQNKPDPDTIELICGVLDITPTWLFNGEDENNDLNKSREKRLLTYFRRLSNAAQKKELQNIENEVDSSSHLSKLGKESKEYWEKDTDKEKLYHSFLHEYFDYKSPYTEGYVDLVLRSEPDVAYKIPSMIYEYFYDYTKERLDSEFSMLLKRAEKVPNVHTYDIKLADEQFEKTFSSLQAASKRPDAKTEDIQKDISKLKD